MADSLQKPMCLPTKVENFPTNREIERQKEVVPQRFETTMTQELNNSCLGEPNTSPAPEGSTQERVESVWAGAFPICWP